MHHYCVHDRSCFSCSYDVNTAANTDLNGGASVTITNGFGYIDLTETFDADGFSYYYYQTDQVGSLSHIVGTEAAANVVEDLERWNINAQELYQLDYKVALEADDNVGEFDFTTVGPYRSSDHDPLLVSFEMAGIFGCAWFLRVFQFSIF